MCSYSIFIVRVWKIGFAKEVKIAENSVQYAGNFIQLVGHSYSM